MQEKARQRKYMQDFFGSKIEHLPDMRMQIPMTKGDTVIFSY